MELLTEHNLIFSPNPELKILIIYYYKETITTGSVHTMHNNVDNEENFLLGNAVQRKGRLPMLLGGCRDKHYALF